MRDIQLIRDLAARQHGFVSSRQLQALGASHHSVRNHVIAGSLIRVTSQVLRVAGAPDVDEGKAMVAVLDGPDGSVLSHKSAAALWGLPGFRLDRDLHVVVPRRGKPRRTRTATVHYQLDLPVDQRVEFRSVPVTTPALTMIHLAAVCPPDRVERALDRAWSDGLLSGGAMVRLLGRIGARGRNGVGVIRELMEERGPGYVPPASNLESRFHRIIDSAPDIPAMRRQVDLGGEMWVGRVDFVWEDLPGVVEVQSERYHSALVDRNADRIRIERLGAAGLSVVEVWDTDVFHRPWVVVERVRDFRRELESARFGAQRA